MSQRIFSNNCAVICYIIPGYPNLRASYEVAKLLLDKGIDALELGIPFSDPIADGKTIQNASYIALKNGIRTKDVLEFAKEIGREYDNPIYIMSYLNPILKIGFKDFAKKLKESNVTGSIFPDLPVEYIDSWRNEAIKNGIEVVLLCSPSTSESRMLEIINKTTGFIYLVSVFGITGAREEFPSYTYEFIQKFSSLTNKPFAVGFGISKPEHVRELLKYRTRGVIIGSKILEMLENQDFNTSLNKLEDFIISIVKTAKFK